MDRLKAMDTFVRIAKAGSLSKVANDLRTSRALVSRHLKELEDSLGVRLLNRTTRQVALTEVGAEYLEFCQKTLASFDEVESSLSRLHIEPRGTIKVLASTSFGAICLSPIIGRFSAKYPSVHVSLTLGDTAYAPLDLIEKGYDAAVCMHELEDSSLIARKIAEFVLVPCATPEYLRRNGKIKSPDDLRNHNCLFHKSRAPRDVWRFEGRDSKQEVRISGSITANSVIALRTIALMDLGIALLPTFCVAEDLMAGRLVNVLPKFSIERRSVYLVYPDTPHPQRKIRVFADFVQKSLSTKKWDAPALRSTRVA